MKLPRGIPHPATSTIDRQIVFDTLDQAAPVTFICAPHGFGKTTALVRWLHSGRPPDSAVVWIRQSRSPTDDFWRCAREVLERNEVSVNGDARCDVIAAIRRHTHPVLLIVDSAENSPIDDLFALALSCDHVRIIVTGQRLGPSQFRRLDVVETTTIDAVDLAFTEDEACEVLHAAGAQDDQALAPKLHHRLAGRPDLVHRAAVLLADPVDPGTALDNAIATVKADLWRRDVDDGVDDHVLAFATRLAIAVREDDATASVVIDRMRHGPELTAAFDRLRDLGWIVAQRGVRRRWRFVPVVSELLSSIGSQPSDVADLHRALIAHYAERGDWDAALAQAHGLADPVTTADLIERNWLAMTMASRERLATTVAELPARRINGSPVLQGLIEMLERVSYAGNRPAQIVLEGMPELTADNAGERAHEYWAIMLGARFAGKFDDAAMVSMQIVPQLTGLLDGGELADDTPDGAYAASEILSLLLHAAISMQLSDELDAALELFHASNRHAYVDAYGYVARNAAGSIAMQSALDGRMHRAEHWAGLEAQYPPLDNWIEQRLATAGNVARGWIAVETLDGGRTHEALRSVNAQRDDDELWSFIVELQTASELLWGHPRSLAGELDWLRSEFGHLAPPGSYAHTALLTSIANLRLAAGQAGLADAALTDAPATHPSVTVARARAALLAEDWHAVLAYESAGSSPRRTAELALMHSAALLAIGCVDDASLQLSGALNLMSRHGLRAPLAGLPRHLVERLQPIAGAHTDTITAVLNADIRWAYPATVERIELTASERQVLDGLARGLSVSDIAAERYLSANTIKTHNRTLYRKLDVRTRAAALSRARNLGLRDVHPALLR